tara:strand:- start:1066 stop:1473 length:408 start_codon:yes stop_codon:yes gene_type:complete
MHSITARLKLTEFIDTEIEDWVINKINEIYKIHQFKLHLWYDEGELKPKQLKTFVEKYEKELHFKTTITPTSELKGNDTIWFDIIPDNTNIENLSRFTFRGDIVSGLKQFKSTLEFCKKPKNEKPIRKQKRNDVD